MIITVKRQDIRREYYTGKVAAIALYATPKVTEALEMLVDLGFARKSRCFDTVFYGTTPPKEWIATKSPDVITISRKWVEVE